MCKTIKEKEAINLRVGGIWKDSKEGSQARLERGKRGEKNYIILFQLKHF